MYGNLHHRLRTINSDTQYNDIITSDIKLAQYRNIHKFIPFEILCKIDIYIGTN